MLRYVDVEALNFRSQPVVSAATRVAILHLGQPVEVLGSPDQTGWARISVEIDGQRRDGFVSENFLRAPVSDARSP